jgi:hypothetical protein
VTAITLDGHRRALRSTRNRPRRAVRRGAAWPADRAAGWSCGRQSRAGRWPTTEPSWLPSPAGAVHRNTVGWPSARPLGMVAQEVRMPAVPSSACRCLRPASGVQCLVRGVQHHACLSTRLSGVRCGRLSVQMSGVRCPVSGVQRGCPVSVGSRVHCVRPGGGGGVAVDRQPHGWDGRRQRDRLPCPRPVRRLPGSEPGGRGWRRSAGSAEGSAWTWPSS